MLKKVHIFEPEKSYEALQCSMCEAALSKSILYVCKSGHVVCEACRTPDKEKAALEHSMVTNSKARRNKSEATVSGCRNMDKVFDKNLASGDHQRSFEKGMRPKSMSDIEYDRKLCDKRQTISEEGICTKNKETTMKYKNVNFCDSDSSVSNSTNDREKVERELHRMQRPITCPVTACHRIIARDSVLQHFYFDHSKVPRITIILSEDHKVFIKVSSIFERVLCYGIFLVTSDASLPRAGSSILMNGGCKNSSFLLMGARMPSTEVVKKRRGNESVYIRHVQTQTGAVKTKSSKIRLKADLPLKVDQENLQNKQLNKDGPIMLWICKLGDSNHFYCMSVKREDKKLGYSVTGETINISDSQDCHTIYNEFHYLHIREKDVKKLTNNQEQLEINVNIFK